MGIRVCKRCQTYLLDHDDYTLRFYGWKKCPSCNWCCDREGYNLKEPKVEVKEVEIKESDKKRHSN